MNYNWGSIPERMRAPLLRWFYHGIIPGGFLAAVLRNDLHRACINADDENRHLLWDYVIFLHNEAPAGCWGSPKHVDDWQKAIKGAAK